jgi:hypothetical protein
LADSDELIIKIGADFDELKRNLKKAGGEVENFGDDAKKVGGKIDKVTKGMGRGFKAVATGAKVAAAGIAVMGAAIAAVTKTTLEQVDAQNLWAKRLKISQEQFSNLSAVGQSFGATVDDVGDSIKDLNERIADAASGNKTYEEAFQRMGLASKDLINLPVEQQFLKVADAISKMNNVGQKNFVVADLMADAGFRLMPMFDLGAKGIEKMYGQMKRLNVSMSSSELKKFEELNAKTREMGLAMQGAGNKLTLEFAPAIEWLSTNGVGHIKEFTEWYGSFVEVVSRKLGTGSTGVMAILAGVGEATSDIRENVKSLKEQRDAIIATNKANRMAIESAKKVMEGMSKRAKTGAEATLKAHQKRMTELSTLGSAITILNNKIKEQDDLEKAAIKTKNELAAAAKRKAIIDKEDSEAFEGQGSGFIEGFAEGQAEAIQDEEFKKAAKAREKEFSEWKINNSKELNSALQEVRFEERQLEEEQGLVLAELRRSIEAKKAQEKMDAKIRELAIEQGIINEFEDFKNKTRQAEEEAEKQHQFAMRALWESGMKGKLKVTQGIMGQLSSLMSSENRKMFEVGKAAATANAVIDTISGAQKAYTSLAGIPVVGPALGAAAAGAAILAGTARVQQIQSTTMGGGGGGVGAVGAGASTGGDSAGGQAPQETINQTNFDITLQGESYSGEQVRSLIGAINDEVDDGARIGAVNVK